MRCKICVVLMALCCLAAPVAAEEKPAGPPPAPAARDFAAVKQQMLQRIDQRIGRLHQEQDCVKAATNHKELKACRPNKRSKSPVAPPPPASPVAPTPMQ